MVWAIHSYCEGDVKPYVLKVPRRKAVEEGHFNRITTPAQQEGLTGYIGEWEASDIEERFARSLIKEDLPFTFREHFFGPARTTPGAIEVDFLVFAGMTSPIFIDGEYAHKSQAQKDSDSVKDAIFDEFGMQYGFEHSRRIPGDELETQEQADNLVKEMF